MKDSQGTVLYVGKAKNLRNRLSSYLQKKGDSRKRIPFLMKKTTDIDTIVVSNETEAILLENNLIKNISLATTSFSKTIKHFSAYLYPWNILGLELKLYEHGLFPQVKKTVVIRALCQC